MKSFSSALAALGLLAATVPANAGLLYGVNLSLDTLDVIDTTSFVRTTVGPLGANFRGAVGLAYDSGSDRLFSSGGSVDTSLYSVDRNTGTASIIGNHGISRLFGLAFDSLNDVLYGVDAGGSGTVPTLVTLDTLTGTSTSVALLAGRIDGLAYDSTNDRLLGYSIFDGLFEIDRTTGFRTLLDSTRLLGVGGLAYDPDQDLVWSSDAAAFLVTFDPNNGFTPTRQLAGGRIGGSSGFAFVSTAVAPAPVPEPSTLAALGVGLLTIGIFTRRRRKV